MVFYDRLECDGTFGARVFWSMQKGLSKYDIKMSFIETSGVISGKWLHEISKSIMFISKRCIVSHDCVKQGHPIGKISVGNGSQRIKVIKKGKNTGGLAANKK